MHEQSTQSKNENQNLTIGSVQLSKAFYSYLQQLQAGKSISIQELARVHSLYPQGLLNGRPKDPDTLASVFSYLLLRLPLKILDDDLKKIHISNNSTEVMRVPHTSESDPTQHRRKHAPARSRWYLKEPLENNTYALTFESRDVDPANPTDSFEILSWLGSLEQIRVTILELVKKGVCVLPLQLTLRKAYKKHLEAEIAMLDKKILMPQTIAIRKRMMQRSAVLNQRLQIYENLADELFKRWLARKTTLKITIKYPGQISFEKIRIEQNSSVVKITSDVLLALKRNKIPKVTDILFGNDFSLRIFLCMGLFSHAEYAAMEEFFCEELEKIKPQLATINIPELQNAAIKFFLVQQVSLYEGSNTYLATLKSRIYSVQTFENIGIKRLVATSKSAIADPVDVIMVEQVTAKIMSQLPKIIQELLHKITNNNQIILSIPYTLGNLTQSLITQLYKEIPTFNGVGFIGKVGTASDGTVTQTGASKSTVGDLVLPTVVANQFNSTVLKVQNSLNGDLQNTGYPIRKAKMLTTAALTFQEPGEMEVILNSLETEEEIVTLDVELFHLMSWYQRLDTEQQAGIKMYLLYYISDKTVLPKFYDKKRDFSDKISESLGNRGSVALFISIYSILSKLAEPR